MRRSFLLLLLTSALLLPQATARARYSAVADRSDDRQLPAFLQPPTVKQNLLLDLSTASVNGNIPFSLTYERVLDPDLSWQVSPNISSGGTTADNYFSTGARLAVDYWFHADFWPHPEPALLGWFAGPQVGVGIYRHHWTDGLGNGHDDSSSGLSAGALGGYQWIFHPGLTARAYAQVDAIGWDSAAGTVSVGAYAGATALSLHAAVGWSF